MSPPRERCSQHGLLIPDGGACVLCRRESQHRANRVVLWVVAALAIAGLAGAAATVGWRRHKEHERALQQAMKPALAVIPHLEIEPPRRPDWSTAPTRAASSSAAGGGDRPVVADSPAENTRPKVDRAEREKRVREAVKSVAVKVYVTDWCPVCTQARAWLRASGISYDEVNIENSDSAKRELKSLTGRTSIPTFDIEGSIIQGFSPESVTSAMRRAAEKKVAKEELAGL